MLRQNRISIVNDNEISRVMLAADYEILEASNGGETIEILQQQKHGIAIVLLNIVTPGMDGFETLSAMNQSGLIGRILLAVETLSNIVEFRNGGSSLHMPHICALTEMFLRTLQKVAKQHPLSAAQMALIANNASALRKLGSYLDEELKIRSRSAVPEENTQLLSSRMIANGDVFNRALTLLEWEQVAYQFFAFVPNEVQLEYSYKVNIRTMPELGTGQFSLPVLIEQPEQKGALRSLAGLNNHSSAKGEMRLALQQPEQNFALIPLGLDSFKEANDNRGHISGAQLLQHVAGKYEKACGTMTSQPGSGREDEILLFFAYKGDLAPIVNRIFNGMHGTYQDFGLFISMGFRFFPETERVMKNCSMLRTRRRPRPKWAEKTGS